jgi:hypothetical protein
MAGFFDGEGCISFHSVGKNVKSIGTRNRCYSVACTLTNNHIEVLLYIQNLVGGKIYTRKSKNEKHSDCYALNFTSRESILFFLEQIKDNLIIKQKQAEIVITYIKSRFKRSPMRGSNIPIDDNEFDMIKNVRSLNSINNKRAVLI